MTVPARRFAAALAAVVLAVLGPFASTAVRAHGLAASAVVRYMPTTALANSCDTAPDRSNATFVANEATTATLSPTKGFPDPSIGGILAISLVAVAADTGGTAAEDLAKSCVNSFTADTPVTMADGSTKPIKDVKVGDKVLATDPQTGETRAEPVVALIRHSGEHSMVLVTLADGSVLDATGGHKVWDATPSSRSSTPTSSRSATRSKPTPVR